MPSLGKTGHFVRLELHRQLALVDADNMQVEVPLKDLMPDLGQEAVREQIGTLRKQILDQAAATEAALAQARRVQEEYQHSLSQQKERARQFDTWLSMISRVKVGDEVPIALKPGHGILTSLDFTALRAKVKVARLQPAIARPTPPPQPARAAVAPQAAPEPTPAAAAPQAAPAPAPTAAEAVAAPAAPDAAAPQAAVEPTAETALPAPPAAPPAPAAEKPVPPAETTTEIDISIQDLFPQTGPFSRLPAIPPPAPAQMPAHASSSPVVSNSPVANSSRPRAEAADSSRAAATRNHSGSSSPRRMGIRDWARRLAAHRSKTTCNAARRAAAQPGRRPPHRPPQCR